MRRADRQTDDAEARLILERGEYGVLSLTTPEGGAYGVPLSYVLLGNAIYFHCAPEGTKLELLRAHPAVSFCVVGATGLLPEKFSTRYESAIVFGTATEVRGEEKREALVGLVEKYSPAFRTEGVAYIDRAIDATCVVKIAIERVTGKARR